MGKKFEKIYINKFQNYIVSKEAAKKVLVCYLEVKES